MARRASPALDSPPPGWPGHSRQAATGNLAPGGLLSVHRARARSPDPPTRAVAPGTYTTGAAKAPRACSARLSASAAVGGGASLHACVIWLVSALSPHRCGVADLGRRATVNIPPPHTPSRTWLWSDFAAHSGLFSLHLSTRVTPLPPRPHRPVERRATVRGVRVCVLTRRRLHRNGSGAVGRR